MKVSESYMVCIDIAGNEDESVLTVSKYNGHKISFINNFFGEEAEWMYKKLTGKEEEK